MELDGYACNAGIAFEYQGYQHYELGYMHKTVDDFRWQQQRDQEKLALCAANGVHLIVVPWTTKDLQTFLHERVRAVVSD